MEILLNPFLDYTSLMGTAHQYECPSCEYSAIVAGGREVGTCTRAVALLRRPGSRADAGPIPAKKRVNGDQKFGDHEP